MNINKEDFERAISLAYKRGRVTPIRFIKQKDIDKTIADIYTFLGGKIDQSPWRVLYLAPFRTVGEACLCGLAFLLMCALFVMLKGHEK